MEKKIVENHIHAAIFCSPHNPCGRVWERREVEQAMALYKKYDVMVVSDEIWSDILLTGYRHTPTQSVSEDAKMRTVALYAPSKTFNLAGLVGSYHIIYNSWLRDRCDKEGALSHYNAMNVMSMHALLGAYKPEGCEWVEELRKVITGNVDFACDYIAQHFNGVEVSRPQGTYMLFLDCEKWLTAHGKSMDELLAALDGVKSEEFKALMEETLPSRFQEAKVRAFLVPMFDEVVSRRERFALPTSNQISDALVKFEQTMHEDNHSVSAAMRPTSSIG